MPQWHYSLDLVEIFADPDPDPLDQAVRIAQRVRASRWSEITCSPIHLEATTARMLEEDHARMVQQYWGQLQDLADVDRVWLEQQAPWYGGKRSGPRPEPLFTA